MDRMSDHSPGLAVDPPTNVPEWTVGELSLALKRTVEDAFGQVRVRGEISGFKRHSSGHLYFALKDADALIDGVCWRGTAARLGLRPEDGMEVIATGRLTTYPGRSKYQIVVEAMALAGEGALLKLLEDRRKRLLAEGLFEAGRKRPLPFLPAVIGVVTSPTGAVIRDILHRLADRFPRRVLIWPVAVQGEGAAEQVARAIRGFNALPAEGPVPRPELLIVARGGGSLEDLWAFNEEVVVRAAAESRIPLISAVGHETDTTLIDFASDRRAPTPTAAAEMAVPVRAELLARVAECDARLRACAASRLDRSRVELRGLARGLPDLRALLDTATQRLDDRAERLAQAGGGALERLRARVEATALRLRHPREMVAGAALRFEHLAAGLARAVGRVAADARGRLDRAAPRLRAEAIREAILRDGRDVARLADRLAPAGARRLADATRRVERAGALLDSFSYERVLERGFALVREPGGAPVTRRAATGPGQALEVVFADGAVGVTVTDGAGAGPEGGGKARGERKPGRAAGTAGKGQGSLL